TIHSDRLQEDRETTIRDFRKGTLKILIATDVSARGIDIPNVEYVVNYDLPETPENYVHRVGRTGRGRDKGQAFSFCSTEERSLLNEIEDNLGKPIRTTEISKADYQYTLNISDAKADNWQALMKEANSSPKSGRRRNKKKR
ncbi:MAG: C-terminal helicase domain-containing protein, partial [Bacteroidota bacterium]